MVRHSQLDFLIYHLKSNLSIATESIFQKDASSMIKLDKAGHQGPTYLISLSKADYFQQLLEDSMQGKVGHLELLMWLFFII